MGLAAARALWAREIPYVHVEADAGPGGIWRHGMRPRTRATTPRHQMAFPGFPMDPSLPLFPLPHQVRAYLEHYAAAHGLTDAIQFGTKVVWVRPAEDNLWEVTFDDGRRALYKGVLVCSGQAWAARWPLIAGTFTGDYLHARDFADPTQLRDKRVLVIGGGTTGCDVVCEAARVAQATTWSLRGASHILPRFLLGQPIHDWMNLPLPLTVRRMLIKSVVRVINGPYSRYGLPAPETDLFDRDPVIGGEVLEHISAGRVTVKREVRGFEGSYANFEGADRLGGACAFDVVICATGYNLAFPFLPDDLCPQIGQVMQLQSHAVLPGYRHFYLLGGGRPWTGFGPMAQPMADLVAQWIGLQDRLDHPLGLCLQALRNRPPQRPVSDPRRTAQHVRAWKNRDWLIRFADHSLIDGPGEPNVPLDPPAHLPSPPPPTDPAGTEETSSPDKAPARSSHKGRPLKVF